MPSLLACVVAAAVALARPRGQPPKNQNGRMSDAIAVGSRSKREEQGSTIYFEYRFVAYDKLLTKRMNQSTQVIGHAT